MMCGICGIWSLRAFEPVDREAPARMCASIRHRGPDDSGVYFDDQPGLGLGVHRLAKDGVHAAAAAVAVAREKRMGAARVRLAAGGPATTCGCGMLIPGDDPGSLLL